MGCGFLVIQNTKTAYMADTKKWSLMVKKWVMMQKNGDYTLCVIAILSRKRDLNS